jgi:hypothetical protein
VLKMKLRKDAPFVNALEFDAILDVFFFAKRKATAKITTDTISAIASQWETRAAMRTKIPTPSLASTHQPFSGVLHHAVFARGTRNSIPARDKSQRHKS